MPLGLLQGQLPAEATDFLTVFVLISVPARLFQSHLAPQHVVQHLLRQKYTQVQLL